MPAIEVDEWIKDVDKPGYIRRDRGRKLKDIARDIENLLDKHKCGCDYWTVNCGPKSKTGHEEFPSGEVTLRLEVGSNEGYSLYVGVERRETPGLKVVTICEDVIRFKLLLTDDDALKAHNVVFRALMLTR